MKVIFIADVPRVARAGETKEVADGYGRNYLLPKKLAVLADSQASAVVEAQLKKLAKERAQTEAEMRELAVKLNGMQVALKAKAGARERLYGSITSADVADELDRSAGLTVDKRKIELPEAIHTLGSYDVTVRFTQDIVATLKLTVVAEGAIEGEGEKADAATATREQEAEAKVEEEKKAEPEPEKVEKKGKAKAAKKEKAEKEEGSADKEEKKRKVKAEKEEKAEAGKEEKKSKKKAKAEKVESETKES